MKILLQSKRRILDLSSIDDIKIIEGEPLSLVVAHHDNKQTVIASYNNVKECEDLLIAIVHGIDTYVRVMEI